MQIIEKNSLSVRSAVYRLKRGGDELEFVLFPMIHIGSKSFFDEVRQRLSKCDLILMEGVQSKKGSFLTLSYRVVRKIKRMELVTQQETLRLSDFSNKIVNTDMQGEIFNEHWTALPMSVRALMLFVVPVYAIYLFFFGTKEIIAENIAIDDLASRDEILNYDEEFAKLDSLLVDKRDQVIITRLENLYQANRAEKKTVGVVYGASHMRNIVGFLSEKLGYKITASEWITVFDL